MKLAKAGALVGLAGLGLLGCSSDPESGSPHQGSPQGSPTATAAAVGNASVGAATAQQGSLAEPILAAQPVSEFPVGNEWNDQVAGLAAADALSEMGYVRWQRAIVACMERAGFDYEPGEYLSVTVLDLRRAMNPLNELAAERFGYHVPAIPEPASTTVPSPEFALALGGDDSGSTRGCAHIAMHWAHGEAAGYEEYFDSVQALVITLHEAVGGFESAPPHMALLERWSDCMGASGFDYEAPQQAAEEFAVQPLVSQRERDVRQADLACDRRVGLTAGRSQWERVRFEAWQLETATTWAELDRTAMRLLETLTADEPVPDDVRLP